MNSVGVYGSVYVEVSFGVEVVEFGGRWVIIVGVVVVVIRVVGRVIVILGGGGGGYF